MTMIERVARAMLATGPLTWDQIHPKSQSDYIKMARAAIAAMREPTPEMFVAARTPSVATTRVEWQSMIDEALK